MMRGWIIAAVLGFFAADALAQDGGRYRQPAAPQARYTALPSTAAQAPPQNRPPSQPPRHDANVVPAAARSPRESSQNRTRRSQGAASEGSLLSKLKLPNLLPKSLRSESSDEVDDAPLPYDPAEVAQAPRASRPATQRTQPSRQPAASMRHQAVAARPAAPLAPQRTVGVPPAPAPAPSRVARSSPPVSHRRNELADALSGLTGSPVGADAEASEELAADTPAIDEVVPPADGAEALPSYLQGSPAASRVPAPAKPRNPGAAPLDIRDALLGAAPKPAGADEIAADATQPAEGPEDLGAIPAPAAQAESPAPAAEAATKGAAKSPAPPQVTPAPSSAAQEAFGSVAAERPNPGFDVEAPTPDAPEAQPQPAAQPPVGAATKPAPVLSSTAQPVIVSKIEGPQQIVVGKQAEYRIIVENKGAATAVQLSGTIVAPEGAEVIDAVASNGVVVRGEDADPNVAAPAPTASNIRWQLYELAAGAQQTLTIKLVPRAGRELNLGVQWVHAPVLASATVVIQEPKLQMDIAGPAEVLFGKSQRYALTISNPGNGSAEEVAIELTPPGGDKNSVVKHKIGTLGAGESKKIELELTAREAGELKIQAAASASGNLHADAMKTVLCRRAELQVDWRGPEKKYAGAVATYYIRLRNPGTAAAEQVGVQMVLPAGAELIEASEGNSWDADRRTIVWKASSLQPGEERFMELQCRLTQAGVNNIELSAQTAAGDLSAAKSVPVMIEALADLKLEVVDPQGVIPVGEEAVYEIHIANRGMNAARGVNVVGMFSEGIDPTQVEGAQHTMRDGRVTFRTIDDLAAGSEMVLKIKAKASKPGTHVFRAEVACDELEAKLAAEETTRFFNEDQRWADASTAYSDEATGTQTR